MNLEKAIYKYSKYKLKYLNNSNNLNNLNNNQLGGSMDNILSLAKYPDGKINKIMISISNSMVYEYDSDTSMLIFSSTKNGTEGFYEIYDPKRNTILLMSLKKRQDQGKNTKHDWFMFKKDTNELLFEILHYQENKIQNINTNRKIIILCRHAESEANKINKKTDQTSENTSNTVVVGINNPSLTEGGQIQSINLKNTILNINNLLKSSDENSLINFKKGISLIITSPLKRTIMTAKPFVTLEENKLIPIKSSFLCTEIVHDDSSIGFFTNEEFKTNAESILGPIENPLDLEIENYNLWATILWKEFKNGISPDRELKLIEHRAKLFHEFIKSRNENVILIYSHAAFIKFFSEVILHLTTASYKIDDHGVNAKFDANHLQNANFLLFMHE